MGQKYPKISRVISFNPYLPADHVNDPLVNMVNPGYIIYPGFNQHLSARVTGVYDAGSTLAQHVFAG